MIKNVCHGLAGSVLAACTSIIVMALMATPPPARGESEPTPTPHRASLGMSDPTGWTNPPPAGPRQVDKGAYTYWMHCMVCHGDKGQGLALFRASYPKADQNCATSRCHGGPRPGAGFSFPDAPAIEGPGTLTRFKTAGDLYAFISTRMPYQAPGSLSTDEYWSLVAYLLSQHSALPDGIEVTASNAGSLVVQREAAPQVQVVTGIAVAAAASAMAALGLVWLKHRRM